jgi:hypothetical protein
LFKAGATDSEVASVVWRSPYFQSKYGENYMRVLVKRILKKYGYPPDLADYAVQTVLAQAEILLREAMP